MPSLATCADVPHMRSVLGCSGLGATRSSAPAAYELQLAGPVLGSRPQDGPCTASATTTPHAAPKNSRTTADTLEQAALDLPGEARALDLPGEARADRERLRAA